MPVTRVKSQDVGDGAVGTTDLAGGAVTFPKLAVGVSPALENDGTDGIRVKVDGTSIQRTSGGVALLYVVGGGLALQSGSGIVVKNLRQSAGNPLNLADADQWYDTTTTKRMARVRGATITHTGLVKAQIVNAPLSNTTTKTALAQAITIPANFLTERTTLRIRAGGVYSCTGSPTLTIDVWLSYPAHGLDGLTLPCTTNAANGRWWIDLEVTIRSAGAAGTAHVGGFFVGEYNNVVTQTQALGQASVTIDTTVVHSLALVCQWSAASVSNVVTMRHFTCEVLD